VSAAAGFADAPRCCLNAEILVRFLCSGKPVGVVFNLGADGAVVGRSLISPMNAEAIDGTASEGSTELVLRSSSSSERSIVKRCPLKSMVIMKWSLGLLMEKALEARKFREGQGGYFYLVAEAEASDKRG
jgi:hypothetical protein